MRADESHLHVLVADGAASERERSAQLLTHAGFTAFLAQDDHSLFEAIRTELPDVVVIDPRFHQKGVGHLIPHIRSLVSDRFLYVIITMPEGPGSDIAVAFAAGANDFMRKPFGKEELLARVNGLRRLQAFAHRHEPQQQRADITTLPWWNQVQNIVGNELSDMFGTKLGIGPAVVEEQREHTAEVVLTLPEQSTEVHLVIGFGGASAQRISEILLGHPTDAHGVQDILFEMCNHAAGALKRAALADGVCFTLGLPRPSPGSAPTGAEKSRAWSLGRGQRVGMHVAISALVQQVRLVRLDALHEGMVCATDVRNSAGLLLAAAGTRVTEVTAERLRKLLGPSFAVEILFGRAA